MALDISFFLCFNFVIFIQLGFNNVNGYLSVVRGGGNIDVQHNVAIMHKDPDLGKYCEAKIGSSKKPGQKIPLSKCPVLRDLILQQEDKELGELLTMKLDKYDKEVCCPLDQCPTPNHKKPDSNEHFVESLPEPPMCGVSVNLTLTKVVGGENASLGAFRWMALLGYKCGEEILWNCGGSLITPRHVLTAAHCIYGVERYLYQVRLGELDVSSKTEGASPIDVHIKDITVHENYDYNTFSNDIAVITLDKDVEFNEFIQPICLPFSDMLRHNDFNKYMPLVAGWGAIQFSGSKASRLQFVQLSVLSNGECQDKYAKTANVIDNRAICAGSQDNKDACTGDSGGPLMLPSRGPNRKHFQYVIGVVSHGIGCGTPGIPGVYSRVTEFLPWISKHTTGKTI